MNFGALIIGDEILSGRRSDKHLAKLIELLGARGLKLSWARYVGDDFSRLTETLRQTFATGDVVFSFGGIGATPDDRTREAAGAALGLALALHPEAEAEIRARFGAEVTPERLQMGVYPVGSEIIPNSFNRIPGFSIRQHYFTPGFPIMAWPMVEWVLDTHYRDLFHATPESEASIVVYDLPESAISPLMSEVEETYPGLKSFSLPNMGDSGVRRHIELGARGVPDDVKAVIERFKEGVQALGGTWSERLE